MHGLKTALVICLALPWLAGCDPFAESRKAAAERLRVDCTDLVCDGDVKPAHDQTRDQAIKLNGQWYIGPREYYNGRSGVSGFEWWEHRAISAKDLRPAELQQLAVEGKGYDYSIEIFLTGRQRWPESAFLRPWERSTWDWRVRQLNARGETIERQSIRPGLDMVRIRKPDGSFDRIVHYIATHRQRVRGDGPPVLSCNVSTPPHPEDRCYGGEYWQEDVFAEFRFRSRHATDWPEIHAEAIRVLNLLKKAQ